jgi:hypothetical protein
MKRMPVSLNRDVSNFFMCYTKACRQANDLLFQSGNAEAVDEACKRATVGKLLPNALYVHREALDSLEPLLRDGDDWHARGLATAAGGARIHGSGHRLIRRRGDHEADEMVKEVEPRN